MKSAAAADFEAARDAFREHQTTNGATCRCTGEDATKRRAAETTSRRALGRRAPTGALPRAVRWKELTGALTGCKCH